MGRISSFTWGVGIGGASYLALNSFAHNKFKSINSGLRSFGNDLHPDRALHTSPSSMESSVFHEYKQHTSDAFKATWNNGIRSAYRYFVSILDNPYLTHTDQAEDTKTN